MKKIDSGVYLHNGTELLMRWYKEPMTELKSGEGFGFKGAILQTVNGDQILCNICGGLFTNLGFHLQHTHKIKGKEYKEKFGLAYQTALVSDSERMRLRTKTLEWLKTLTPEQKAEYRQKSKEKMRGVKKQRQPKQMLETKNKRGTCPDQLLSKIKEVAEVLGRTPSKYEFNSHFGTQKYTHKIYETFGSWSKALEMLKMTPKSSRSGGGKTKHRDPDILLEYLTIFAQENNKIPTFTDFKNSFLPSYNTYQRKFGSIDNARRLAGVYELVSDEELAKFNLKRNQSLGNKKINKISFT